MSEVPPDQVAELDQAAAGWNQLLDKYIQAFKTESTAAATLHLGEHLSNNAPRDYVINLLVVAIRRLAQ